MRAEIGAAGGGAAASLGWITWSSLGLGAQGAGQLALLLVLARCLSPTEFGVVSAAMIAVGICRVVHASIGPALVQRQDLRDVHVASAHALAWWSAAAMVALSWLAAPSVEAFFHADGLAPVMRAMSLLFVGQAPGIVPEALLQRAMRLRRLAVAEIAGVGIGYLPLGMAGAFAGLGVWALVAAHLGQAVTKTIVLATAGPHARRWWPERAAARDLLCYSGGVVAAGLCNFAASQGDNVVVGRSLSAAHLGIYGRAYQLMAMPAMFLGEVVDRIVFPILARFQHDRPRLALAYVRGNALVAAVMTPCAGAGIVLAPEIVRTVLGQGWQAVEAPLQVLLVGLVFRTGYKISDLLARATGTVYARAWRQGVFALLILGGATVGSLAGVTGVAWGVVLALGVNYLLMAWLSLLTTGLTWSAFLRCHVRGLAIGVLSTVVVWLCATWLRQLELAPAWTLLASLCAGAAAIALAAARWPLPVLGSDGLWLLHTLTRRRAT